MKQQLTSRAFLVAWMLVLSVGLVSLGKNGNISHDNHLALEKTTVYRKRQSLKTTKHVKGPSKKNLNDKTIVKDSKPDKSMSNNPLQKTKMNLSAKARTGMNKPAQGRKKRLNKATKKAPVKSTASSTINKKTMEHATGDTQNNQSQVNITMIPIVTMQRSASTYLAQEVLGELPCHISLNEIFLKGEIHSGDAMKKEGKEYDILGTGIDNPMTCVMYVVSVAKRRCQEYFVANPPEAKKCGGNCFVNFKQHDHHMEPQVHGELWKLLAPYNERIIVLERTDIEQEWKSLEYSKKTHDWHTLSIEQHKESMAKAKTRAMPKEFQERHDNWYMYANRQIKRYQLPVLKLTYERVTETPIAHLRLAINQFLKKYA